VCRKFSWPQGRSLKGAETGGEADGWAASAAFEEAKTKIV